jgi:hypothetical protein
MRYAKFDMPSSKALLVMANKLEAKYGVQAGNKLHYTIQIKLP